MIKKSRKALSPIIATVLMVAIVITIGVIIFAFFKGTVKEAVEKFGENADLSCGRVSFSASMDGGKLTIRNSGNVPIYDFIVKSEGPSSSSREKLSDSAGAAYFSVPTGGVKTLDGDFSGTTLIPQLLGTAKNGKVAYTCDDSTGVTVD